MNPNIEYELLTQKIYQELVNSDALKPTNVLHNVKLKGKSGQEHQIDVYWEYEMAGIVYKVAIECKNYGKNVGIGKVRDFYGVLSDLNNIHGIIVTKIGYQKGAKAYANEHGIKLVELRIPKPNETILGPIKCQISHTITHCLYLVDEKYAEANNLNLTNYRKHLEGFKHNHIYTTHIPLPLSNDYIINENGEILTTLPQVKSELPESFDKEIIFTYENAYINSIWGRFKIREIKFIQENETINKELSLIAQNIVKAIHKDAITGKVQLIMNK